MVPWTPEVTMERFHEITNVLGTWISVMLCDHDLFSMLPVFSHSGDSYCKFIRIHWDVCRRNHLGGKKNCFQVNCNYCSVFGAINFPQTLWRVHQCGLFALVGWRGAVLFGWVIEGTSVKWQMPGAWAVLGKLMFCLWSSLSWEKKKMTFLFIFVSAQPKITLLFKWYVIYILTQVISLFFSLLQR